MEKSERLSNRTSFMSTARSNSSFPLRKTQTKRDSPIIGAVVVEYTQTYEILDAERPIYI